MPPLQSAPIANTSHPFPNIAAADSAPLSTADATLSQRTHNSSDHAPGGEHHVELGYTVQSLAKEDPGLQESRLTNSSIASNSGHLNPTSSNNSQSTMYTDLSPPTTSSGPSSQEKRRELVTTSQADSESRNTPVWAETRIITTALDVGDRPAALSIHTTPTSPAIAGFPAPGLNHGQKRTASGAVKPASTSLPASPIEGVARGHSRNTSVNSSSTQIGELSSQLRTRLSYAMVKVQNGWQDYSLDEVESLASQQASPVSRSSVLQGAGSGQQSPKLAGPRPQRAGFSQSPDRTTNDTRLHYHKIHGNITVDRGSQFLVDPQMSISPGEAPTYESFWRQHSAKPAAIYAHGRPANTTGPSLEPPADIFPRNSRRSNLQQLQPPSLHTNNISNLSTSSEASVRSLVPATPPSQKRVTAIRTPSQNAAMEKDAVETLLFMSSPVNSGYLPRTDHLPSTPMRIANSAAGKRVEFAGASGGLESSDEEHGSLDRALSRQHASHEIGRAVKEDEIDKMLDAMGEADSSSEEEIELRLH